MFSLKKKLSPSTKLFQSLLKHWGHTSARTTAGAVMWGDAGVLNGKVSGIAGHTVTSPTHENIQVLIVFLELGWKANLNIIQMENLLQIWTESIETFQFYLKTFSVINSV